MLTGNDWAKRNQILFSINLPGLCSPWTQSHMPTNWEAKQRGQHLSQPRSWNLLSRLTLPQFFQFVWLCFCGWSASRWGEAHSSALQGPAEQRRTWCKTLWGPESVDVTTLRGVKIMKILHLCKLHELWAVDLDSCKKQCLDSQLNQFF